VRPAQLLVRRRPSLRVVVMSATIDVDKFAAFFECVPPV
jgi:HrpA-like RNA helicase